MSQRNRFPEPPSFERRGSLRTLKHFQLMLIGERATRAVFCFQQYAGRACLHFKGSITRHDACLFELQYERVP